MTTDGAESQRSVLSGIGGMTRAVASRVGRTLPDTAKVMAENPTMLRFGELEVLQDLTAKVGTGKVGRPSVRYGTGGLMDDLVRRRE
mgnify:CR=1 FL=1